MDRRQEMSPNPSSGHACMHTPAVSCTCNKRHPIIQVQAMQWRVFMHTPCSCNNRPCTWIEGKKCHPIQVQAMHACIHQLYHARATNVTQSSKFRLCNGVYSCIHHAAAIIGLAHGCRSPNPSSGHACMHTPCSCNNRPCTWIEGKKYHPIQVQAMHG